MVSAMGAGYMGRFSEKMLYRTNTWSYTQSKSSIMINKGNTYVVLLEQRANVAVMFLLLPSYNTAVRLRHTISETTGPMPGR